MATGEDLSEDANPRLRGRKPHNDDILDQGVWILHPETKVTHLVTHKYQVNRLLMEGGKVVEKPEHPTQAHPVQATAQGDTMAELKAEIARLSAMLNRREDMTNGSTSDNGADHSSDTADDRRPGGDEPAIPGSGHPRHAGRVTR